MINRPVIAPDDLALRRSPLPNKQVASLLQVHVCLVWGPTHRLENRLLAARSGHRITRFHLIDVEQLIFDSTGRPG